MIPFGGMRDKTMATVGMIMFGMVFSWCVGEDMAELIILCIIQIGAMVSYY
jgi:hypothetical protein